MPWTRQRLVERSAQPHVHQSSRSLNRMLKWFSFVLYLLGLSIYSSEVKRSCSSLRLLFPVLYSLALVLSCNHNHCLSKSLRSNPRHPLSRPRPNRYIRRSRLNALCFLSLSSSLENSLPSRPRSRGFTVVGNPFLVVVTIASFGKRKTKRSSVRRVTFKNTSNVQSIVATSKHLVNTFVIV